MFTHGFKRDKKGVKKRWTAGEKEVEAFDRFFQETYGFDLQETLIRVHGSG